MRLDVYLDLGNVAGLIALAPTLRLIAETNVDVCWLPIQGIVPRPLSREPKQSVNDPVDDPLAVYKHARWVAKQNFEQAELKRDCTRLGLSTELASRAYDGKLTHLVWLGLNQLGVNPLDYIKAVFKQRFESGQALEAETAVRELGIKHGMTLEFQALADIWSDHQQAYLDLGIHDSPSYVLKEETFQGRQHLPLIRWRIGGEQGTPPL